MTTYRVQNGLKGLGASQGSTECPERIAGLGLVPPSSGHPSAIPDRQWEPLSIRLQGGWGKGLALRSRVHEAPRDNLIQVLPFFLWRPPIHLTN